MLRNAIVAGFFLFSVCLISIHFSPKRWFASDIASHARAQQLLEKDSINCASPCVTVNKGPIGNYIISGTLHVTLRWLPSNLEHAIQMKTCALRLDSRAES